MCGILEKVLVQVVYLSLTLGGERKIQETSEPNSILFLLHWLSIAVMGITSCCCDRDGGVGLITGSTE